MSGDSADRKGTKRKLEDSLDAVANEATSAENVSAQVRVCVEREENARALHASAPHPSPDVERVRVRVSLGGGRAAPAPHATPRRPLPPKRVRVESGRGAARKKNALRTAPLPDALSTPIQTTRLASVIVGLTKDGAGACDRSALRRATHALADLAKTGEEEKGRGERARGAARRRGGWRGALPSRTGAAPRPASPAVRAAVAGVPWPTALRWARPGGPRGPYAPGARRAFPTPAFRDAGGSWVPTLPEPPPRPRPPPPPARWLAGLSVHPSGAGTWAGGMFGRPLSPLVLERAAPAIAPPRRPPPPPPPSRPRSREPHPFSLHPFTQRRTWTPSSTAAPSRPSSPCSPSSPSTRPAASPCEF